VVVGVGGAVHVVARPEVEVLGLDGVCAVLGDCLAMEVVAGGQLQVAVHLFAH
jgi:hypothetical protein